MKKTITLILLVISIGARAQEIKNWQVSLQLQPELTIHKHDYASMYREGYMKTTFNAGVASLVQRNFGKKVFAEAGVGFVARRINASVFLNKARMFPSPSGFYTEELIMPQRVSYRILQFPIGLGLNILNTESSTLFIKGTYI